MNRELGNNRNAFIGEKFCDKEGSVTWGVVMMEHPFFCNVWCHANDPFSESFKDVFIKKDLVTSLTDMLKTITVKDFQRSNQKWEQRLHRCVAAQGNYFEDNNIDV